MRLYSLQGHTSVQHDDGTFDADEHGAVEVPHDLGEYLHSVHIGGLPAWEDEARWEALRNGRACPMDPATACSNGRSTGTSTSRPQSPKTTEGIAAIRSTATPTGVLARGGRNSVMRIATSTATGTAMSIAIADVATVP